MLQLHIQRSIRGTCSEISHHSKWRAGAEDRFMLLQHYRINVIHLLKIKEWLGQKMSSTMGTHFYHGKKYYLILLKNFETIYLHSWTVGMKLKQI